MDFSIHSRNATQPLRMTANNRNMGCQPLGPKKNDISFGSAKKCDVCDCFTPSKKAVQNQKPSIGAKLKEMVAKLIHPKKDS